MKSFRNLALCTSLCLALAGAGCEKSGGSSNEQETVPAGNVDLTGIWESHGNEYWGNWPNKDEAYFTQSGLTLAGTCFNEKLESGSVSGNRIIFQTVIRDIQLSDGTDLPNQTNNYSGTVNGDLLRLNWTDSERGGNYSKNLYRKK